MNGLPLIGIFEELRRRDFPLGVQEYAIALRALDAGIGLGGPTTARDELTFLLQALWAKSPAEQRQVRDVIDALLPRRLSGAEIDRLDAELRGVREAEVEARGKADAGRPRQPNRAGQRDGRAPADRAPARPGAPNSAMPRGAGEGTSAPLVYGLPDEAPQAPAWQLSARFDLVGTLPVSLRQMHRAWRRYRRMARVGAPTEFDAAATLERLCRDCVLASPVFVPRRTNRARALLLVDEGGSMQPFSYVTAELVSSARLAGLARVDVWSFHDVPGPVVRRPDSTDSVKLEAAAAPFTDAGVMIYGDAGAARGGLDTRRVIATCHAVDTLRRFTPAIAWLNPVPSSRWTGTSAAAIRERSGMAMFPLDRAGLEAAIDTMRGLVR